MICQCPTPRSSSCQIWPLVTLAPFLVREGNGLAIADIDDTWLGRFNMGGAECVPEANLNAVAVILPKVDQTVLLLGPLPILLDAGRALIQRIHIPCSTMEK